MSQRSTAPGSRVSNPNGHHRPFKRRALGGRPEVGALFQIPTDITGLSNPAHGRAAPEPVLFQIPTDITGLSNRQTDPCRRGRPYVSNPNGHHRPFKRGDTEGDFDCVIGFKSQRTSQAFQTFVHKIVRGVFRGFKSQRTSQAFQTRRHLVSS